MFLIDMDQGRIIDDTELKKSVAQEEPYGEWLKESMVNSNSLPLPQAQSVDDFSDIVRKTKSIWLHF